MCQVQKVPSFTNHSSSDFQLENAEVSMAGQRGKMRSTDHQFQQPMVVAVMAKQGGIDVPFDVEGSGYGFKVLRQFKAHEVELPTACKMNRPH